jgi:branched-chain amino acid transport system substrate-binding protein
LAVRDFGMIHGHAVELGESIDTGCGPEGGRAGAEQIIADPQVVGVIGTNCSGAAVAASPLLSAAGLVMISPSNTSPVLTSDLAGNVSPNYHPGYFRTSNNDLYEANAVADFAYGELGLRRLVAIDDGDPYTMGLTVAFGNAFHALGGEVAVTARIEKGVTDMTAILTEFAAAEPDGIYFPLFDIEGAPFAEQARKFDGLKDATLITSSALLLTEFLAMPQSEGIYFAGPEPVIGSNVNDATGKSVDEVLAAFAATYGGSPNTPYWAHSYDATTLLLNAIETVAGEAGGKLYVDRTALRGKLHATSGFQGLLGTLSCDNFGDCGTGRINIYHHTDLSITDPAQLPVVYRFTP